MIRAAHPSLLHVATANPIRLLHLVTFGSGGCALLLEQIYEKYLATLLGSSRPAATIVLATFFLGLAIGAYFCPKRVIGAARRLAALELFVAAWAVFVGVGFFASYEIAAEWLAQAGTHSEALAFVRFTLAVVWILPPTIAMGAQLPTLTATLQALDVHTPEVLSRLYCLNVLGGFAFTLLAPVVLFNFLGADGALWTAAALSAALGAALWFGLPAEATNARILEAGTSNQRPRVPEIVLAAACGFVFFALEVLWFHLISAVCGASTYSFSLLLAAVLLALAIAGWHVSRLRLQDRDGTGMAIFQILGRVLPVLAVSCAAWPHLGRVFSVVQTRLQLESFWAGETLKFLVIAIAIIPSAAALGTIFPLLLRGIDGDGAPGSRRIGAICAANVLGCVGGALIAGFVMIPSMGAERGFLALWIVVAIACVVQGWRLRARTLRMRAAGVWAITGVVAVLFLPDWDRLELTRGFGVYFRDSMPPHGELVFDHEDHHAGFVTVVRTAQPHARRDTHTLFQNGKFDADDHTQMPAQIGFGLVAALHAPAFGNAMVIGCGSGQTASVVEGFGFAQVEVVELSPGHIAAAREWFSAVNRNVLDHEKTSVILDDGRNWLLRSASRYDLIQIEVSSIWFAGATNLYSREFYDLLRRRLNPGGVMMQWFQLHHLTEAEVGSIIATVQESLPELTIWRVGLQACILASAAPLQFNQQAWERWSTSPRFDSERKIAGFSSPPEITRAMLVSTEQVRQLLARSRYTINTDRNRWLEFHTPKYYLSRRDHLNDNLRFLERSGLPDAAAHTTTF